MTSKNAPWKSFGNKNLKFSEPYATMISVMYKTKQQCTQLFLLRNTTEAISCPKIHFGKVDHA